MLRHLDICVQRKSHFFLVELLRQRFDTNDSMNILNRALLICIPPSSQVSLIAGVPNSATPVSVVLKNVNEGGSFSNLLGTSFADDGVAFPTASASFNGTFMPATSLDAAFATPSNGESETPALAWFACMACGPQ